jgi:hypothetical protein
MEGQDRRHHSALFGARVRELSAVDAWHGDRRHRAVSTWRRPVARGLIYEPSPATHGSTSAPGPLDLAPP